MNSRGPIQHEQTATEEVVACKICGLVQRVENVPWGFQAQCVRCDDRLLRKRPLSRQHTAAFSLAALAFYIPANLYPIMHMEYLGRETDNTVWGGVQALYRDGMWGVAMIVFCASILIPLLKLLGLFFLVASRGTRQQMFRTGVYRLISQVGPWAMLDVFLLAIIVALIRFGRFATIIPGPGIVAFVLVVAFTLLASSSFDPRLIWKEDIFESDRQITG